MLMSYMISGFLSNLQVTSEFPGSILLGFSPLVPLLHLNRCGKSSYMVATTCALCGKLTAIAVLLITLYEVSELVNIR